MKHRKRMRYRRFSRAADAIRFAIETLSPELRHGALLEVNEERFSANDIRRLYDDGSYPLQRGMVAIAGE